MNTSTQLAGLQKERARNQMREKKIDPVSFIRLEPIIEILRAAIWTNRVADSKPVSVILVAEQESAKTEALKFFEGTKTLLYLSDITSKGLSPYKYDIEAGRIRHLILLDLVRILEHANHVTNRTIQVLASLMEEGESESSDAGGAIKWSKFPKIGLLAGVTPAFFKGHRNKWRKSGFMSRFLPVRFSYSKDTVRLVHNAISLGYKLPKPQPEILNEFPVQVNIPEKFATIIKNRAISLGQKNRIYGFRYHNALRALVKGEAARNKRNAISEGDLAKLLAWSEYFTGDTVEI